MVYSKKVDIKFHGSTLKYLNWVQNNAKIFNGQLFKEKKYLQ
jgi:hypothetical protein